MLCRLHNVFSPWNIKPSWQFIADPSKQCAGVKVGDNKVRGTPVMVIKNKEKFRPKKTIDMKFRMNYIHNNNRQ